MCMHQDDPTALSAILINRVAKRGKGYVTSAGSLCIQLEIVG